jgi:TonB-linked SusC/RagA family outer membrane protein
MAFFSNAKLRHWSRRTFQFLVMKLAIFFLVGLCAVQAKGISQTKVTLDVKDAPLERVLTDIGKQTGMGFTYTTDIRTANKVDITVTNATVDEALNICFKNQPFTYDIVKNTIVVKTRLSPEIATAIPTVPVKLIKALGTVYNESGQPLSGANVTVKETGRGTITNAKGEFELREAPENGTLIISYVGYTKQLVKIKEGVIAKIFLQVAKNDLDKVVIQAYGTTTQRLNTGNIATVTAAEIERHPVMNPLEAIQGRVPGVIVTETSGYASAPVKIEIRGRSVIDGGQPSEPLYIIDGVPLTVLNLQGDSYVSGSSGFTQSGLNGPAGGQSPFFSVNPKDIESITVLKDADATAIYGSRGANGVIMITTKSGKPGKAKLDISVDHGESVVTGRYHLLNTQQYLMMRREAFKNDQATYGLIPGFTIPDASNAYDLVTWDSTRYTDFQNIYWSGMGKYTSLDLSLSGGDKQNNFRLGVSYANKRDITSRTGTNQRGSMQFNYTHKSLDQKVTLSLTSMYSFASSDLIGVSGNVLEAPDAPAIYNSEGALNWAGWVPNAGALGSFSGLFQPYYAKTGFLNNSLSFQYEIFKGFKFSMRLGYNASNNSNRFLIPIISQNPINANPTGRSQFGNANGTGTMIEPQLDYKTVLGRKGKLSLLAGTSAQSSVGEGSNASGFGYINDNLLRSLANAPIKTASNGYAQYKYAALFGRINYNLDDEVLLNISARRDGSSKFGPGRQYGNFWAFGAAWIFTEQAWFKKHVGALSFGKLRASYGLTGNDQIANYGYLTQWSAQNTIPYQSIGAYVPLLHANPDLHWETNYKLEGALELGIFKDRLSMELAFYRNRCGDQLVGYPLPIITGFGSVVANSPALVQNTGYEMTLRGKFIDKKEFSWTVNFNIGFNRNKLVSFPNFSQSPYAASLAIGQSLSITHLLHYLGVDPQTGQYTFQDKNHDGQITNYYNNGNNDFYNKDLAVPFDGGIGTDLRFKGVQLNLFFYFVKRTTPTVEYNANPGGLEMNQSVDVLDRWQKPGDHARFARFTTQSQQSDIYFAGSDGVFCDGSYVRLRNASLSYEIPESWRKKLGMQQCLLYARGENLFTATRYNGLDPAVASVGAMPTEKTFIVGIQFTF